MTVVFHHLCNIKGIRDVYLHKSRIVRKSIHYIPLVVFFILVTFQVHAQIGGNGTYKFLNYANSARVAGMGGNFLAIRDHDLSVAISNPSLISPEMHHQMALSYVNSPGGINYGFAAYSRTFNKTGSFAGSLQFINYGTFTGADATGQITGDFSAGEYALNLGWGRRLSKVFFIGANGKLVYSHLDSYHSFGLAVDVAGTYHTEDESFTASVIGRSIGSQFVPYVAGQYEALPFDLQIGLSQKLRHVPLRFSQLFNNLHRWNLSYDDPYDPSNQPDPISGEEKSTPTVERVADEIIRHVVLGAELTIARVLAVRIGYNYQRRQELKLYDKAGLAGFSFGAGLRIKMLNISYTRATLQAGSPNPNYITVGVNFNEFTKKQ